MYLGRFYGEIQVLMPPHPHSRIWIRNPGTCTVSWTASLGSSWVPCWRLSVFLSARFLSAFSLSSCIRSQSECGLYLESGAGKKSLSCLPKMTWAGERPVLRSGVFLYYITALWNLSEFNFPSRPRFSLRSLFIDFTASSALWLECGNATLDSLWWTS